MVNVATAFVRVVRYRVVVQIPANFGHIFVQHIFLAQFAPAFASPESKTVLWPTLRAIPIAAVFKYRLVDRLQYPSYRRLYNLVFQTNDSQWPAFTTTRFGDVASTLWLRTAFHILEPLGQIFEAARQVLACLRDLPLLPC